MLIPAYPSSPRIFCVGMNKTGTNSLREAFEYLGLRTLHRSRLAREAIERATAENKPLLTYIENYECYTDAPFYRYYRELDRQYPGSRFILNTRDTGDWISSRIAHDRRWNERKRLPDQDERCTDRAWLRALKERCEGEILTYFSANHGRFVILDICAGQGWRELCDFLGCPIPTDAQGQALPFPFENRNSDR